MRYNRAFTLIELVVVIAVVSLLVSAVMMTNNLINSSKLTAQNAQFVKYEAAVVRFFETYKELPGDISVAYNIWGSECDSDSDTCNGNGNGKIGAKAEDLERIVAWRHLSLAKMIEGEYLASATAVGGSTVPLGKVSDSMVTFASKYETDGSATLTGYNSFYLVANDANCNRREILTSSEMYLFDKKFDDGLLTGKISASENDSCTPVSSGCVDTVSNSYLNIDDDKTKRCFLGYTTKFSFF